MMVKKTNPKYTVEIKKYFTIPSKLFNCHSHNDFKKNSACTITFKCT